LPVALAPNEVQRLKDILSSAELEDLKAVHHLVKSTLFTSSEKVKEYFFENIVPDSRKDGLKRARAYGEMTPDQRKKVLKNATQIWSAFEGAKTDEGKISILMNGSADLKLVAPPPRKPQLCQGAE